jgi:membrane-associated phospholipid phosphatase
LKALPRHDRPGPFAKVCSLSQQPASWAALALVLASLGGARGRRAAWRGLVSYAVSGVAANVVVKPLVRRSRPPEAGGKKPPVTSSFPSGHSATEVAFALAAAQEMPSLLVPLLVATVAGKVSIIRTRGHYLGDVVAGSVAGIAVSGVLWRVWRPGPWAGGQRAPRGPREFVDELNHYRFRSTWTVDQPPEAVYPVLEALEGYPAWWPEVKSVTPSAEKVPCLEVRALLPYSLTFSVENDGKDGGLGVLEAEMEGDLRGTSKWTVAQHAGGSRLVFDEDVVVGKRSLRLLAPIARLAFRANHSLMMRHGQKGLRAYLRGRTAASP